MMPWWAQFTAFKSPVNKDAQFPEELKKRRQGFSLGDKLRRRFKSFLPAILDKEKNIKEWRTDKDAAEMHYYLFQDDMAAGRYFTLWNQTEKLEHTRWGIQLFSSLKEDKRLFLPCTHHSIMGCLFLPSISQSRAFFIDSNPSHLKLNISWHQVSV